MNHYIKKVRKFAMVVSCIFMMVFAVGFVTQISSSHIGYLKAAAMDGYSENHGIRGFVLPAEKTQPASVKAVEEKQPLQIDTMQIVFIGLIAVGILISIGMVIYWLKIAK